jgi:hypothetical protein
MNRTARRALALLTSASFALIVPIAAAAPAHADRCQPEELDPVGITGIVPEPANPVCLVADEIVYPLLGCPPPTTLMGCQTSVAQIRTNAPNVPAYALNAAFKAPGTAVNFVTFAGTVARVCVTYDGRQACVSTSGVETG